MTHRLIHQWPVNAGQLEACLLKDTGHLSVHENDLGENVRLRATGNGGVGVKEDTHQGGTTARTATDKE